ncbi:D-alanyl-D-alanine carboxypeptidase family protein [Dietzia sp.]|uniref:D-alanyl-D-alanine carboxypeptidase family protein n=1 Tax=Dietzia sp. TaxID=1871616 RepID=UPI002FDAAFCD
MSLFRRRAPLRALALSAVMGLGLGLGAAGAPVAGAQGQQNGLADQTIQSGVPGLDPGVSISQAPPPAVLPTEPNFQYFSSPRDLEGCPQKSTPPAAVDHSEEAQPGQPVPPAPSVQEDPVGGEELGGCAPIAAEGFQTPGDITASGWIVADAESRQVLAAQDPHGRYRPASIIKLLLALVALDRLDLDKEVTVSEEDIAPAEGTLIGLGPGGKYSIRDILSGMLLLSGNDAAYELAAQLGGEQKTLELMGEKCAELGCTDTVPATISGLDKPGNMTSPYDMALIFSAALNNDTYREIAKTKRIGLPGYPAGPAAAAPDPNDPPAEVAAGTVDAQGNVDNGDGSVTTPDGDNVRKGFVVYNDNQLLEDYPGAVGGKTGFTDDARQTYVGGAERDGRTLLVVLMDGTRVPKAPFDQAAELLDAGFATDPKEKGVGELVGSKEDSANAAGANADGSAAAPGEAGKDGSDSGSGVLSSTVGKVPPAGWIGIAALVVLAILFALTGRRRRG